jgi:hypothetical protein
MFQWLGIGLARQSWKIARLDNIDFCKELSKLNKFELAGNFIPERFDTPDQAMDGLKIIVEEWNIKDLRMGIRWSTVDKTPDTNKLDLSHYTPFLDYCFEKNVKIVLSLGPIKSPGYPEEYIPWHVWQKIKNNTKKFQTGKILQKTNFTIIKPAHPKPVIKNKIFSSRKRTIYTLWPSNAKSHP